jgi:hypothetical protein
MTDTAKDVFGRFLGIFLFPRIAAKHRRWTTRTWAGFAFVVVGNTFEMFAVKQFLLPCVREWGEWEDRQRAELTDRLGREPTAEEVRDFFVEQARSEAAR